jgi:hypothetical protein
LRRGSEIVCRARTGRTAPRISAAAFRPTAGYRRSVSGRARCCCARTLSSTREWISRLAVTWACDPSWSLPYVISGERWASSRCFHLLRTHSTITMWRPCSSCPG